MQQAFQLEEIEARVLERRASAAMLLMASYNGEESGHVAEFLRRVDDYHLHTAQHTDVHCVGYSLRGVPKPDFGDEWLELPSFSKTLSHFHPRTFHEVRASLQRHIGRQWSYAGGVDILVFGATGKPNHPVDWEYAAFVTSRHNVGTIYQDVEHMLRDVFNESEAVAGHLRPEQLSPHIRRRQLKASIRKIAYAIGGDVVGGLMG